MNNQPDSSSIKGTPATPSSSNQKGKTQVFILTPDILKKLGIASKIPSLATASNSTTTAHAKKDDANLGDNMIDKLASVLNKKINESNETKNVTEAKKNRNPEDITNQKDKEENSVKTKLLSMLTSKLDKEKIKSTSSSSETRNDKQTGILKNQIKPIESNTSNVNETKLLQNSNNEKKEISGSKIEKRETDLKINELCKNNIKIKLKEINIKYDTVQKNESMKNIQSNIIAESNEKTNTKELIDTDTKLSVQSTSLLNNILRNKNKDKKICITDAEKYATHDKVESKVTKNEPEQISVETNTEKATPTGRKRKITEESSEDSELVSPVRKSGRKRKLSTLHTDYVTELKLHDGSSQKLPHKGRKSIEIKFTENPNDNVTKNNELNENNNSKLENNTSKNESQNLKTNNETIKVMEIEENIDNMNSKLHVSQDIHSADKTVSKKNINTDLVQIKLIRISEENKINQNLDQELNLTINALESPLINDRILTNNESNNNLVQLTTVSHSGTSENNTELKKQVDPNIHSSPKKQIIIHENILIKSPQTNNICNFNLDSTITNKTPKVLSTKETAVKDTELDFKVISPLKTYSSKIKERLSTDAQVSATELKQNITKVAATHTDDSTKLDNLNDSAATVNSSTQDTEQEINTTETIVLVRRRRSRPEKDNTVDNTSIIIQKNNSTNLSEFENFFSSTVTTELKTNQSIEEGNAKQDLLTDFNETSVTTPVKQIPKQIKNIQESIERSKPETVDSPIDNTGTGTSQIIEDVNEEQKILTTETKIPVSTTIQGKGHQPKQNKNNEESFNKIKLEIIDSQILTAETKTNEKQEILTDTEIKIPVSTPVRRKGRPPKHNKNCKDSINKSNPETVDSSIINIEIKDNQVIEDINVKQEILTKSDTIALCITPARRRGRPPKENKNTPSSISLSESENSPIITTKINMNESIGEITDSAVTPTIKRDRGKRKKNDTVVEEIEQNEENFSDKDKYLKVPGRGRKRIRQEIEKGQTSNKSKDVTCAVCNEVVDKWHWTNHSMKHNFLCWKVGEPAINLNDRKHVEYILFKGLKDNSRFKQFTCTSCSDKKKSVLGFLAHLEICQLSEEQRLAMMEICTVCKKKVMPQSMKSHMKTHEHSKKREVIINETIKEDINTPRTKRKAAAKAANLIQEVSNEEDVSVITKKDSKIGRKNYKKASDSGSVFMTFGVIKKIQVDFNKGSKKCKFVNCKFECNDFDTMKAHLNACPTIKNDEYICRYCLLVEKNENTMKEHVLNKHLNAKEDYKSDASVSDSDDDDYGDTEIVLSDAESNNSHTAKKLSKPPTEYIRPTFQIGFLARERRIIRDPVCTYHPALRWTYEFCRDNYSEVLFENIKCFASKWTPISLNEHEKYIPSLKKSMSVKSCAVANKIPNFQKQHHEWKEYDLYESSLHNDTVTIFCGGPIWALAWVPTPLNLVCDQYLAVSLQKNFESNYKLSESPNGREIIQFWNFGPLDCKEPLQNLPTLEFSIVHNHGMVWYMEWCASGYYDTNDSTDSNELKKLGLLALACSDGNIPIYAIGVPHEEERNKNNIFNIKPAFKLILQEPLEQLLGRWNYQVTKISWSKSLGHNIIAGGYSNGVVCLWDLENYSPLLRSKEKDVIILKPYQTFQAHTSAISALVLYPLIDEGKRWLLTGSWDRTFKYWDVNNTAIPISTFGKRGIVTDGVWISHWLCSFFAYDDVFSLGHTVSTVQNPRDFGFKQCSALASNSVVMSLSSNDWASSAAQGTLAGELITTFPRTILISYDVDKHLKCKRMMLSYNEIIDKTKNPSERKDIMKSEKKPEKTDNEKDEKLFARYLETKDIEPYVEEPNTYEKVREKYGLLFCDFKLAQFNSLPQESLDAVRQSNRLREVPTEMYPFTSLNRVVWNPNKQAYLYVASGYQSGFVRLRCIRFMNSNQSIKLQ